MKEVISEFHLDELSERLFKAFGELCQGDEFRAAEAFR
jgi:hypothetical protein